MFAKYEVENYSNFSRLMYYNKENYTFKLTLYGLTGKIYLT